MKLGKGTNELSKCYELKKVSMIIKQMAGSFTVKISMRHN